MQRVVAFDFYVGVVVSMIVKYQLANAKYRRKRRYG